MGFEKGNKYRFTSTNQPAKNGRKPAIYTKLKNAYSISLEEYRKVVQHLMNCTKDEITELAQAKDTPIWIVNLCTALVNDTKKGTTYLLTELTDRLYGKPKQVTENYNDNIERNKATVVFVKEDNDTDTL
jgi:hypothetical protein